MVDPRTIVVGMDASQESAEALTWARSIASSDDRIEVLHAWEIPVMTGYDMVVAVDIGEVERIAEQGLHELVDKCDDARLAAVTRRGHAGRALVEAGRKADLIVVGHRGDSRLSLMLGSTANYVMHHATTPVVIVRGDERAVPPKRVVVGVDDVVDPTDAPCVRALAWAINLPGVEHVRVVHAWFMPALAVGMFHPAAADLAAMDAAALRVVERALSGAGPVPAGLTVSTDVVRGAGGFALVEESRHADLVVVGHRGRGGFSELVLGSTAAETAAHSHAPVAVIH